jgi:glucose-1-phosphate cytidylyltransferase
MGTRLAEETDIRPKPMVEIGNRPILWHIMQHYSAYGYRQFVIALGYMGEYIKRSMLDFGLTDIDLTVNVGQGRVTYHGDRRPDWTVDLVDTGLETKTGGRIKRLQPYLGRSTFMLTWGDGVSNVNLDDLLRFHKNHGKLATVTAVRPPARFGCMAFDGNRVTEFSEKPQASEGWINGAFFVLEPGIFDYIEGDQTLWEKGPMERLARDGQLMAYRHTGFWQCMDTIHDKRLLEDLWSAGRAPWMTWS